MASGLGGRVRRLERLAQQREIEEAEPSGEEVAHRVLAGALGGLWGVEPADVRVLLRARRCGAGGRRWTVAELVERAAPSDLEAAVAIVARAEADPAYRMGLQECLTDLGQSP